MLVAFDHFQKLMIAISFLLVSFSNIHSQYFTYLIREVIIFAEILIILVNSMKNQENSL